MGNVVWSVASNVIYVKLDQYMKCVKKKYRTVNIHNYTIDTDDVVNMFIAT